MGNKKTLVLGATPDSSRYAYLAANRLVKAGHDIINVGRKKGEVAGVPIEQAEIIHTDVDTITLYVGPQNQPPLYNYIMDTHPKRIIFNPGTENSELRKMAHEKGIETEYACTLVLLSIGQY
ncbi:MAG: CoA-binding protein [Bacteroidota bacterium]